MGKICTSKIYSSDHPRYQRLGNKCRSTTREVAGASFLTKPKPPSALGILWLRAWFISMFPFVLNNQQVTHVCHLHWDHFICHNNHFQSTTNQGWIEASSSEFISPRCQLWRQWRDFPQNSFILLPASASHKQGSPQTWATPCTLHCHCHLPFVHSWQTSQANKLKKPG